VQLGCADKPLVLRDPGGFGDGLSAELVRGRAVGSDMRTRGGEAVEHDGELNTLPYLDVLMNLIIFMLLSMTGLATYGVINATSAGSAPGGDESVEQVHVRIVGRGFVVQRGEQRVEVADHDYVRLSAVLASMKSNESDTRAVLSATADTSYETVTATLDAMRGSAGHRLFPDVALDR
jgi:biopolymer transport protein ExbD